MLRPSPNHANKYFKKVTNVLTQSLIILHFNRLSQRMITLDSDWPNPVNIYNLEYGKLVNIYNLEYEKLGLCLGWCGRRHV